MNGYSLGLDTELWYDTYFVDVDISFCDDHQALDYVDMEDAENKEMMLIQLISCDDCTGLEYHETDSRNILLGKSNEHL